MGTSAPGAGALQAVDRLRIVGCLFFKSLRCIHEHNLIWPGKRGVAGAIPGYAKQAGRPGTPPGENPPAAGWGFNFWQPYLWACIPGPARECQLGLADLAGGCQVYNWSDFWYDSAKW
jgi:hypothetical protein